MKVAASMPRSSALWGAMASYRIIPKRGTYKVELVEPNGQHRVVGTWRTEEAAVSQLRKLEAEAQHSDYKPVQNEVGWPRHPKR
jgi:hypothetical protein